MQPLSLPARRNCLIYLSAFFICILTACSKEKRSEKAAEKMQEFVVNISNYARTYNSHFIIIPQNGIELAYNNIDKNDGLNNTYMSAIDGLGVEELFYNGAQLAEDERLPMLRELKLTKKILVADYLADNNNVATAIVKNQSEGFICFPRTGDNYNYSLLPTNISNANTQTIISLSDAKNYLYLISSDGFTSKQQMLAAIAGSNYDIVLIDLFFEGTPFTKAEINQLKTKANGGQRLVIAYMNIGSAEKFRYYWQPGWRLQNPSWLQKEYDGYPDEYWVQFWEQEWMDIIYGNDNSYTKKIIDAGFDGAYLDNVEAYYFLYHNN